MPNNIKEKLNQLPQEIKDVIDSDLDFELNGEICNKFDLTGERASKNGHLVARLLMKDLPLVGLMVEIKKLFSFDSGKAKSMATDVIGKRLLVFDDYFSGEASKQIQALGGQVKSYQSDISRQQKVISEAEAKQKQEDQEASASEIKPTAEAIKSVPSDDKAEKNAAPEIFEKRILDFLIAEDDDLKIMINNYSDILMVLVSEDKDFKKDLEDALYVNHQTLTEKNIFVSSKSVKPTVANWLKDFIDKNGTAYFDEVKLSEYVTNSNNAKKLSKKEKELLGKLLHLYRNLKFFPQSMGNRPMEQWELIPLGMEIGQKKVGLDRNDSQPKNINVDAGQLSAIERKAMEEEKKG